VGVVKLVVTKYKTGEENDLVMLNNEIIQNDANAVAILVLAKDSVRVLVGAGKGAIAHGIHAGKLAAKLAALVGGGGVGKDNFGQGGGTKLNTVDVVVNESEQAVNEMLRK
jgi:alanyl-tRNA synthetase